MGVVRSEHERADRDAGAKYVGARLWLVPAIDRGARHQALVHDRNSVYANSDSCVAITQLFLSRRILFCGMTDRLTDIYRIG